MKNKKRNWRLNPDFIKSLDKSAKQYKEGNVVSFSEIKAKLRKEI